MRSPSLSTRLPSPREQAFADVGRGEPSFDVLAHAPSRRVARDAIRIDVGHVSKLVRDHYALARMVRLSASAASPAVLIGGAAARTRSPSRTSDTSRRLQHETHHRTARWRRAPRACIGRCAGVEDDPVAATSANTHEQVSVTVVASTGPLVSGTPACRSGRARRPWPSESRQLGPKTRDSVILIQNPDGEAVTSWSWRLTHLSAAHVSSLHRRIRWRGAVG